MSDNTSRRHPREAALWLGKLETSILQFLKLGDRSDHSGMQCFNETIIYSICERLPYSIYHRICDIRDHGRKKLKQIAEIVNTARMNADKRSVDRANRPHNSTLTHHTPRTTTIDTTQDNNNTTVMFESWELLCRGTQRNYPTTNNIFHSSNYARQQGTLDLRRQTNEACRICKLLEKVGRP